MHAVTVQLGDGPGKEMFICGEISSELKRWK